MLVLMSNQLSLLTVMREVPLVVWNHQVSLTVCKPRCATLIPVSSGMVPHLSLRNILLHRLSTGCMQIASINGRNSQLSSSLINQRTSIQSQNWAANTLVFFKHINFPLFFLINAMQCGKWINSPNYACYYLIKK